MAKWKLKRQTYGTEEFTLREGEVVTIGRGIQNTITLSSLVISRNHCSLQIKKNEILVTDLQSSNGVYVGTKKISPNIPYTLKDSDIVGIGWISGASLGKVQDTEKYVFKIIKEQSPASIISRITFQNENEYDEIEEKISYLENLHNNSNIKSPDKEIKKSPDTEMKNVLKRKIDIENNGKELIDIDNIVSIVLSDSDNENNLRKQDFIIKKPKLEAICEEPQKQIDKNLDNTDEMNIKKEFQLKGEEEYTYPEMEAFNVKQEYLGYDEPIEIDSDSDSESEHWFLRLSQSSPGKPFVKVPGEKKDHKPEDSSYSQIEDDIGDRFSDDEDYIHDLITIPVQPHDLGLPPLENNTSETQDTQETKDELEHNKLPNELPNKIGIDEPDGTSSKDHNEIQNKALALNTENNLSKKAQMIEPQVHLPRKKSNLVNQSSTKPKHKTEKHDKSSHSSKRHISSSQKEERKKKLKEIAVKEKEDNNQTNSKNSVNNLTKTFPSIKVTSSNRGAFLTDSIQVVKPTKRKESPQKSKSSNEKTERLSPTDNSVEIKSKIESETKKSDKTEKKERKLETRDNIENKNKHTEKKDRKEHKSKHRHDSSKSKSKHSKSDKNSNSVTETRVPLKSLKPLTDSEESFAGKPFSKVEPYKKPKKTVRFSEAAPEIHYFEIAEGNKMKKTSLVKTTLVDSRQMPMFSLEKITLMKILRWNPHWLEEQINNNEPPPILGHNNPPMAIFHSFNNHHQYVQLIGDLLLMEIWECLSIAYMKIRNQAIGLQMRIATLPPVPTPERHFDIFNLSVDVSLPTTDIRNLPRVGEVLLVSFGPENARHQRFFFVHNVRSLPSPPSNRNSFYNISLHATFTEKIKLLKPGDMMIGINLAYISKELSLFEAMAYMAGSPLSEAILTPEPRHFMRKDSNVPININNPWTNTLNTSQYSAVKNSVLAALGDQPSIQMVQGPPGTGKSSVICSIVMTYFYDAACKRQQNRGKILICATSNAAVDELVLRLLNIRQQLPKQERFRMVRVGRAEAMHPRAREISSQNLAQRELRSQQEPPTHPGLNEEISRLEAKINMWKTSAQHAFERKDDMRVAYCESRVTELNKRIAVLRTGNSVDELRPEQLISSERRIIEGADIVVTTLASAHNHKMRGLKRRIALCIVDEAGQAIEPETLIPLTLDVTNLTLIGDPQQLPGYICSQRAKKYGLGESLFSRLSSCAETWHCAPVALLDHQYRMQAAIADYPNRAFYASRVHTVAPHRPDIPIPVYMLLGISSGDKGQNAAGANEMEAWGVSRLVAALSGAVRTRGLSIAVITPYNAHKELIKRNIRQLLNPKLLSECYTNVRVIEALSYFVILAVEPLWDGRPGGGEHGGQLPRSGEGCGGGVTGAQSRRRFPHRRRQNECNADESSTRAIGLPQPARHTEALYFIEKSTMAYSTGRRSKKKTLQHYSIQDVSTD
ncbi:unnamed protein product [Diatraea saccharalis]|uniref:FHA domain-containing protein n=1 Tax=Diatraea saccharalis TaxID=40085 RepID=A0A9N9RCE3_9NEOP|nr:unnamed protein product [Diatraea saccharalis]